jgi:hypothetical protein
MSNRHSPKKDSVDFGTTEHYYFEIEPMSKTNLSREQLLSSFLHRAFDLSSSGLQIDSEGLLYASGEMIAAWRDTDVGAVLFIDCGSSKVCNRRQVHSLRLMAEERNITHVVYNEFCFSPTKEFLWVERMITYPIWATPKGVNPKNIFAQVLKTLDKAIEKRVSFESIQSLVDSTRYIATLFNFEFDTSRYETARQQHIETASAAKAKRIEYHIKQIERLLAS